MYYKQEGTYRKQNARQHS